MKTKTIVIGGACDGQVVASESYDGNKPNLIHIRLTAPTESKHLPISPQTYHNVLSIDYYRQRLNNHDLNMTLWVYVNRDNLDGLDQWTLDLLWQRAYNLYRKERLTPCPIY